MRKALLSVLLFAATAQARGIRDPTFEPAEIQPSSFVMAPLSPEAVQAFADWHLCLTEGTPPGVFGPGSRRFAGEEITWRVATSPTILRNLTDQSMAIIQGFLVDDVGAPLVTLRKVAYSDTSAKITVRTGTSINTEFGPVAIPSGWCMMIPWLAADRQTYTSAELVCRTNANFRLDLIMHELWWHHFFATACDASSGFGAHQVGPGAPTWEGAPGHRELARWLYAVPAGTLP